MLDATKREYNPTYLLCNVVVQVLTSFEGELESQDDLMALISGSGYDFFDWSAGADIRSTFHPQVCKKTGLTRKIRVHTCRRCL